jgi:hypothetical protein
MDLRAGEAVDSLVDFIAIVLATGAIIDVWHNGSIFATARAIVQAKQDVARDGSFALLWTELLTCPFCKSYHIPIYLYVILLSANWLGGIVASVAHILIYGLAATRASNLINSLLPKEWKYDREHQI